MNIFITGVSSGIGRELTKELLKNGHIVWGVSRRKKLLAELKAEISSDAFFYSVGDVVRKDDVRRAAEEMRARNFLPDVVVLNAAIFKEDLVPQYNHAIFEEVFGVNIFGAVVWVEAFIDKFLKRGSGQFIAVSSIAAFRPDRFRASYPASKAALSMAFRSFRIRYGKDNILFKTIFFGPIVTPMSVHVERDKKGKIVSKKFFVAEPRKAAQAVIGAMRGKKHEYYFPYFITLLFRLTLFLPDGLFIYISKFLKTR